MTLKSKKDRTLDNEVDTRWRYKGGPHSRKLPEPRVCVKCGGRGYFCMAYKEISCVECGGTGEIL